MGAKDRSRRRGFWVTVDASVLDASKELRTSGNVTAPRASRMTARLCVKHTPKRYRALPLCQIIATCAFNARSIVVAFMESLFEPLKMNNARNILHEGYQLTVESTSTHRSREHYRYWNLLTNSVRCTLQRGVNGRHLDRGIRSGVDHHIMVNLR